DLQAERHAADAGAQPPAAGEQARARGRANRADEEAVELNRPARKAIDVRRRDVRVAGHAEVAVALVVGEDEQDVRPRRGGLRRTCGVQRKPDEAEQGAKEAWDGRAA